MRAEAKEGTPTNNFTRAIVHQNATCFGWPEYERALRLYLSDFTQDKNHDIKSSSRGLGVAQDSEKNSNANVSYCISVSASALRFKRASTQLDSRTS
jgi:hypothetical protein